MLSRVLAIAISSVSLASFAGQFTVTPKNDDCKDIILPLAKVLASSAMSQPTNVTIELTGETEEREYQINATGKPFVTGPSSTFTPFNSWIVILSNDSASKCQVQSVNENG
jgi:hypothetical protein